MSLPLYFSVQVWIAALPITALLIWVIRKYRSKQGISLSTLGLESCIAIMLALYTIVSSLVIIIQTIYQIFTANDAIAKLLGVENIPVLILGFFAVIWLAVKEIGKQL